MGTIAKAATPGTTSATITHARAPIVGGEDGIAGVSDHKQRLCFALALWNGNAPILKERLFGLTNSDGNHGEDLKEYYFYLDSTPTHSYMKYLYKYLQSGFPYEDLGRTLHLFATSKPESILTAGRKAIFARRVEEPAQA